MHKCQLLFLTDINIINMKKIKEKVNELDGTYMGIIEDIADPLKTGRVKVRVFGLHTQTLAKAKLPWFLPAFPINAPQNAGIGDSGIPSIGSRVLVGFINNDVLQGFYFATIAGNNDLPNPTDYQNNHRQIKTFNNDKIDIEKDNGITITNHDLKTKVQVKEAEINIITPSGTINITGDTINISGSKKVNIDGGEITFQDSTNSGDLIINSEKFLQYFLNHIHPTGVGPSGPVVAASAGLSTGKDWFTKSITVDN